MTDDTPANGNDGERTIIRSGRVFERTYRLDAPEAGAFLIEVGERLQSGDEITISTEEWELPFRFDESVELEVEFEGEDQPVLEIECNLPARPDEKAPDVA